MKIFFISDIHANHLALSSILKKANELNVEAIYCLGDVSGYFTEINEVVQLLRDHDVVTILGNHDAFITGALSINEQKGYYNAFSFTKQHIEDNAFEWISKLPNSLSLKLGNYDLKLYHGGPNQLLDEYIFPDKIIYENFKEEKASVMLFGHTHLQFVVRSDCKIFANPGSVGLPRNGDFRAHGLLYDSETLAFVEYKIPYQVDEAIINYSRNNYINPKYFHNLNFGRSSSKKLNDKGLPFLSDDLILCLNRKGLLVINTKFGAILSKSVDKFEGNLIYVASYYDKMVEITSNTLIFNWYMKSQFVELDYLEKNLLLKKDNAGLYYSESFDSEEIFNINGVELLEAAFKRIESFKNKNVKI